MITSAEDRFKHEQYGNHHATVDENDDPQTRFYKQHLRRQEAPHASGRTPIYDFDEWSKNHYGTAFNRRMAAKQKYDNKTENRVNDHLTKQKHYSVFWLIFISIVYLLITYDGLQLDKIKTKEKIKDLEEITK